MSSLDERALAEFEASLARRNLAASTREVRLACVRRFLARIGSLPRLTRLGARRDRARRASEIAATTHASELVTLKVFFRCLVDAEVFAFNPFEDVVVRRVQPAKPPMVLSEKAVSELLKGALTTTSGKTVPPAKARALALRNRAALELLYGVGLRASELRAVQVVDLNVTEATLLVRRAKNGVARSLPVPKASVPYLAEYLREGRRHLVRHDGRDRGHLLLTRTGRPLDKGRVGRIVATAAVIAERRAHPHAFRRTLATHLVRAGVQVTAVKELLGHRGLETTAQYVELEREDLSRVVSLLERPSRDGGTRTRSSPS